MTRRVTNDDSAAATELVIAAGMSSADDSWFVHGMLTDYFEGKEDKGHVRVIDDKGGGVERRCSGMLRGSARPWIYGNPLHEHRPVCRATWASRILGDGKRGIPVSQRRFGGPVGALDPRGVLRRFLSGSVVLSDAAIEGVFHMKRASRPSTCRASAP